MAPAENWQIEPTQLKPQQRSTRRVGQYDLLEPLGHGGMGVVWKALHRHLGQTVAIKFLRPDAVSDPQALSRFYGEMRAVGRVVHPHIVRALDAGEYDGQHVLVMEYVDGVTLRDLLRKPESVAVGCEIIRQAALGLSAIHAAGMVHRDLKPSNLFLTDGGIIKILDLGLARGLLGDDERDLTLTGYLLGTVDYMSPEQSQDPRGVDARSDLYSLGCTLHGILAGKPPFSGPSLTLEARLRAHRETPPAPLTELRTDVPAELSDLVLRLLAKDPRDRVQSADELARMLSAFAAGVDLRAWHESLVLPHVSGVGLPTNTPGTSRSVKSASADTSQGPVPFDAPTVSEPRILQQPPPVGQALPRRFAVSSLRTALILLGAVLVIGTAAVVVSPQLRSTPNPSTDRSVVPAPGGASAHADARPPGDTIPRPKTLQLREFSPQPVRVWHKLLDEQPVPIFWKPADGLATLNWVEGLQQVYVANDDIGLVGLGTTDSQDFSLQFGIHQSNWSNGAGVFLGLQNWKPGEAKVPWTCHWLHVTEVRPATAASTYRLDLDRVDATVGPDGRFRILTTGFASEAIPSPSGEVNLEIKITDGRLSRLKWATATLRDLIADANQQPTPVLWTGGFGVMVHSGAATYRNCQFMKMEPAR